MKATRRDLFKFAAGGATGLLLTPAPWRLVTDAALWSENWPGIPKPVRGELRTRFTHCALCPAGCAVKARCVGDQPISLIGLPGKPLCAFGLMGHQLPYHAGRVRQADADAVRAVIAKRAANETVAVLDLRPGRTASWTYRRAMAALPRGVYLAARSSVPAVNLDAVKIILSLGVPVLDGWGTPSNVQQARSHFRLIQAEPAESRTALLADQWLKIRPGTELELVEALATGRGGAGTGLNEKVIASVANELVQAGALFLAAEESPSVLELNRKLGAVGKTIVAQREAPVPRSWKPAPVTPINSVPERSIGVLLIDESAADSYVPWSKLEGKLAPDALVVTFASSQAGYGRQAKHLLPTAVYPESTGDIPPAIDSPLATFRLTTPLVAPPRGVVNPAQFIGGLAAIDAADALRERAGAIHAAGRGSVCTYADGRSIPVEDIQPDQFWKALNDGACWIDEPGGKLLPPVLRASTPAVVALNWEKRAARGPMPPLVSKLYQESNLRVRI
ncbi:MAG TPA: hypothetical protein VKT49_06850 [Bryobacteraceae bacterium]|nr:hypothetical protein [Bryobacteraceae bacterium]